MTSIPAILLLAASIAGCNFPSTDTPRHVHTHLECDGRLVASIDGGDYAEVLSCPRGCRPVLAPDGRLLAVELPLLSNTGVVKLFRIDGGRFAPAAVDVTTLAWRQIARQKKLSSERLDAPRWVVEKWLDDGKKLEMMLNAATTEGQTVEFKTVVDLAAAQL